MTTRWRRLADQLGLLGGTLLRALIAALTTRLGRNDALWASGARGGDAFADDAKYLYLQVVDAHPDVRAVWLSRDSATVDTLRERGIEVLFLSNNSSGWKTDYAAKLDALGVPADPEDVVLSTDGVIAYLDERGAESAYVVGTTAMRDAIADRGFVVDAEGPECVVVGFDAELTYEKVRRAALAIRNGAEFLLAHGDAVCPTPEGFVPDCGAIGALVETAVDRPPARVSGKPNPR